MKFELDNDPLAYQINDYQVGDYLRVNQQNYHHAIQLSPEHLSAWQVDNFDSLTAADFDLFLTYKPDVIILGTGATMCFPDPALYHRLIDHNIGVEVMGTAAACRTYTVLVSEKRRVLAALLL